MLEHQFAKNPSADEALGREQAFLPQQEKEDASLHEQKRVLLEQGAVSPQEQKNFFPEQQKTLPQKEEVISSELEKVAPHIQPAPMPHSRPQKTRPQSAGPVKPRATRAGMAEVQGPVFRTAVARPLSAGPSRTVGAMSERTFSHHTRFGILFFCSS
jgi:hypothetical protein